MPPAVTYHRVPLKISQTDAVLGSIKEDRLVALANMRLFGKIAEADRILIDQAALCHPTAIFRGLRRPMSIPGYPDWYDEGKVLIAVTKPAFGVDISRGRPEPCAAPALSLLVAYLRRVNDAGQRDQIRSALGADHLTVYLVFEWEWVLCDSLDSNLPEDHTTRYAERLPWP